MNEKPILNLRNFVKDTNSFDVNAEIAVAIEGINITLPITRLLQVKGDNDKNFVLLMISENSIKTALEYIEGKSEQKIIQ